ncbi:MAG: epoxyqueuosine reductase [Ruminococcaceae bacterium]|nr:epoxyqueuosine reductase [Oscillospiraceae bacterium]
MVNELRQKLLDAGASEVGFSRVVPPAEYKDLSYAVSICVHLSDAVLDTVAQGPTHTYFHHYRTVNAHLDRLALMAGLFLESRGGRYVSVPASQSIEGLSGLFSHKQAAVAAGLGVIGRSALFLSNVYGPRVRLVTVLTDLDVSAGFLPISTESPCEGCSVCVKACPAMAISGAAYGEGGNSILDRQACSSHMKQAYQRIGRGAVCGICISVCPAGKKNCYKK